MHYREVEWLPAYMAYPGLVRAFETLGMRPVGCMILDAGVDGAGRIAAVFDDSQREQFLMDDQRPVPVLVSQDGTTVVEVSEFFDGPSIRMRTMLENGVLVETLRRWDAMPPWPTNMRKAHSFAAVVPEMTRAGTLAGGRSVEVADGLPDQLIAAHGDHVARMVAHFGAEPYALQWMDDVLWIWNRAFAHAAKVDHRALDVTFVWAAIAAVTTLALAVLGLTWTPWMWVTAIVTAGLACGTFFRVLVRFRYWPAIRPAFVDLA